MLFIRPFPLRWAQACLRPFSLQHGLRQLRHSEYSPSDLARFLDERLLRFERLTAQDQLPKHAWTLLQSQVERLRDGSVKREEGESLDSVFSGRVLFFQARKGYRVTTDSVLLAYFASKHVQQSGAWRFAELGAGGGVVSIALAYAHPQCTGLLLELQPGVCTRAERNIRLNAVQDRLHVVQWDVAQGMPQTDVPCDFVMCNPPFYRVGHGTGPQHPERAAGMYESTATLTHFAQAAAKALSASAGKLDEHLAPKTLLLVYPAVHTQYCIDSLAAGGFKHLHIAKVYHNEQDRANNKPNRILVQGLLGESGSATVDDLPNMMVTPLPFCMPRLSVAHDRRQKERFGRLWEKGRLCDVTLVAAGEDGREVEFRVHSVIVATCSDYRERLLATDDFVEGRQSSIPLGELSAHTLGLLLCCMYGLTITLCLADTVALINAADKLDMDDICDYLAEHFLRLAPTAPTDYEFLWRLVEGWAGENQSATTPTRAHDQSESRKSMAHIPAPLFCASEKVVDYCRREFGVGVMDRLSSDEYLAAMSVGVMRMIFGREYIEGATEIKLFRSVARWCEITGNDYGAVGDLVRYPQMGKEEWEQEVMGSGLLSGKLLNMAMGARLGGGGGAGIEEQNGPDSWMHFRLNHKWVLEPEYEGTDKNDSFFATRYNNPPDPDKETFVCLTLLAPHQWVIRADQPSDSSRYLEWAFLDQNENVVFRPAPIMSVSSDSYTEPFFLIQSWGKTFSVPVHDEIRRIWGHRQGEVTLVRGVREVGVH